MRNQNAADIAREKGSLDNNDIGHVNVERSAYVRMNPSLSARIGSVVYRDNKVTILDRLAGWYEVLLSNGTRGFIRRELVNTMDTSN